MRRALITGITGQDGSYLAESLLNKDYEVYGMHRRCSVDDHFGRIDHLRRRLSLVCGDMLDPFSLIKVVRTVEPDEVYNLAAQSQVRVSFDQPELTYAINYDGASMLFGLVELFFPSARIYQASTSEMFGDCPRAPQNENTEFNPVSYYATSKLEAHQLAQSLRMIGELFVCCGILFNHESPRRGLEFVTRKITDGLARIKLGLSQRETGRAYLEMGNLDAKRDWGFAGDYVEAMWMMMQKDEPGDYVVATGENHSVREFIEIAADCLGISVNWEGEGIEEVGYDQKGKKIIAINPALFRPREISTLLGDPTKAKNELGWEPKVGFGQLVEMMVKADFDRLKKLS